MTDGVIAVDMNGMILHANPAAFRVFKVKEQEIEGKHFNEITTMLGLDSKLKNLIFVILLILY